MNKSDSNLLMDVKISTEPFVENGVEYSGKIEFVQMMTEQSSPYDCLWRNIYYQKHSRHTEDGQTHFHFFNELGNDIYSFNIDGSLHDGKAPSTPLPKKLIAAMQDELQININNINSKYIK